MDPHPQYLDIVTFMIMNYKVVDRTYSILLGYPWLWDAKIIHDQGTNMVMIEGNGAIKNIVISKQLNGYVKRSNVVVNYNFVEDITNEEKKVLLVSKPD